MRMERLSARGLHEVFDDDPENSWSIHDGEKLLGYVCMRETSPEAVWIDFLLAKTRGSGSGKQMLHAVFSKGYRRIEGTAVFGPHFFWERMGAEFLLDVDRDDLDGIPFVLTRTAFDESE